MTNAVWLAGFFDGEGCIGVYQMGGDNRTNYVLQVMINNRDEKAISAVSQLVGLPYKIESMYNTNGPQYGIRSSGNKVRPWLEMMLPYSVVKRRQIELALEFLDSPKSTSRYDVDREWKRANRERIMFELKKEKQLQTWDEYEQREWRKDVI